MTIAYFFDSIHFIGGAATILLSQAKLMSDIYKTIIIIPCDENGITNEDYVVRCERYGLEYVKAKYKVSTDFRHIDIVQAQEDVEQIKKILNEYEVTFIHSIQLNVAVEIAARQLHIPHLMTVYQLRAEEFEVDYVHLYPKFHMCDSLLYSNMWREKLGIESRCIRSSAPKDEIALKEEYKAKRINVLLMGVIGKRKNQLAAIKIIEKCIEQYDVHLILAGGVADEVYEQQCKDYVVENKLENYVSFLGHVSNVEDILKQSDIYICASADESFPVSIIEAITYDLTIVSTPVAGVPELLVDGVNSFISSDFEDESIYEAVVRCIQSREDGSIQKIHKSAHELWETHFRKESVRNQLNEYYNFVIKHTVYQENEIIPQTVMQEICERYECLKRCGGNEILLQRCLYDNFVRKHIEGSCVYIWGAGVFGECAYELVKQIDRNVTIVAYVDKNKKGTFHEYPIITPEEIDMSKADHVLLAFARDIDEVVQFLEEKYGLIRNKNIWLMS